MRPLSKNFVRLAVLYSLIGLGVGIMMVSIDDHSQMPTHAHIMLIGFVTMFLYGIFYRLWPEAENGWLPMIHFMIANVTFLGFSTGFWMIYAGAPEMGEMFTAPSTTLFLLNQVLFARIVFKGTKS